MPRRASIGRTIPPAASRARSTPRSPRCRRCASTPKGRSIRSHRRRMRARVRAARKEPPPVPQLRTPALGHHRAVGEGSGNGRLAWGDLDGAGDGRGLGIAGNCLFVGHANGPGVRRAINIFRIQSDPVKQPPVQVGEILRCSRAIRVRRARATGDSVQRRGRRGSVSPHSQCRHEHHRADGNVSDRSRDVPADGEEHHPRLRRPVARVLPVARPEEFEPAAGLHDDLDVWAAIPPPRPQSAGCRRDGRHRREDRRDAADARRSPVSCCRTSVVRSSTSVLTRPGCSPTDGSSTSAIRRAAPVRPATSRTGSRTSSIRCRSRRTASAST